MALLGVCAQLQEPGLASRVVELTLRQDRAAVPATVFAAAIRVFMQGERYDLACELYEKEVLPAGVALDSQLSGALLTCAMQAGKADLQAKLMAAPSDTAKHIALIRSKSRENDLEGALTLFEQLQASGVQLTTLAYNTLLKAYLRTGNVTKARTIVASMGRDGISANQITYNEMLNALVAMKDRKGMWNLIQDMSDRGMRPNSVTCSILLKSLTAHASQADIQRTLSLVDEVSDMDEVLFA